MRLIELHLEIVKAQFVKCMSISRLIPDAYCFTRLFYSFSFPTAGNKRDVLDLSQIDVVLVAVVRWPGHVRQ